MKVIDLLNKIANGEMPKKFKFDNKIWYLQDDYIYCCDGVGLEDYCNILLCLNDEIEIIEENKKIEKVSVKTNNHNVRKIASKINELIDEVNKLRKEVKDE